MTDRFAETTHRSFGQNILRSLVGIPIGILLFLGSFVVLWMTEGRTDWSRVAGQTVVASPDRTNGADGRAVSVTGPVTSTEPLGDPDFVRPGPFVALQREVEQFAWVERRASNSRGNVGGSSATQTTYTYAPEWTATPQPASGFRIPAGHENPPMAVRSARFVVPRAAVGVWNVELSHVGFDARDTLPPTTLQRAGRGVSFVPAGEHLFGGSGTPDAPQLGDLRVRLRALRSGTVVTAFGQASGASLVPLQVGGAPWIRVIAGDRPQALQALAGEYSTAGWIGRVVGFVMMWIGMLAFLGPVSTFLDVLPMLGSASRFVTVLVTLPLALVLTAATILVATLAHSVAALVVTVAALLGLFALLARRRPAAA